METYSASVKKNNCTTILILFIVRKQMEEAVEKYTRMGTTLWKYLNPCYYYQIETPYFLQDTKQCPKHSLFPFPLRTTAMQASLD